MTALRSHKFLLMSACAVFCLGITPGWSTEIVETEQLEPVQAEQLDAVEAQPAIEDAGQDVATAAEEETNQVPHKAPTQVDYKKLESAGLYSNPKDGSLGRDLWKNATRSTIIRDLRDMPVSSRDPNVQKLIFGVLLSQTDAGFIQNDISPEPGWDLLTLRLEKLIEAGAYRQAFDLYSTVNGEPYNEHLASAGIISMMLNGEKSLACVEANTGKEQFGDVKFIDDVLKFCDEATPEPVPYNYNPESFGKLSLLERAFITASGKIDFNNSGIDPFKVPAADIQILLSSENLSLKNRFLLTASAVSWGLANSKDMSVMYKATVGPASGDDPASLKIPPTAEDWEKIPYYYTLAFNAPDDAAQWNNLRQALALAPTYGTAILSPFAELIYKAEPNGATPQEIESAFRIINADGHIPGNNWIEQINTLPEKGSNDAENERISALKMTYKLLKNNDKNESKQSKDSSAALSMEQKKRGYLSKVIIENVDSKQADSNNANRIYEKEYNLTFKQDYVMPSGYVWNRLMRTNQDSSIGETVLLSASVLQVSDLGDVYPDLLADTLESLNKVGLTDISTDLAMSAVLGNAQTN